MSNYKSIQINRQREYVFELCYQLCGNVEEREKLRSTLNTFPPCGYCAMEQQYTKTAIQREITELRAALLKLSKMID